ncbi:TadE/TadG family type IV pilus assembly protein [Methylobacterium sp. A54F]
MARVGPGRLGACRRGAAAVEFALLAALLLLLLAGLIDLVGLSGKGRELERASTEIANAIAQCKDTSDGSCVTNTIGLYKNRVANALVLLPADATLSMVQIAKVGGLLRICAGNATYLDPEVAASANTLLADQDSAIVVLLQASHTAMLPALSRLFLGQTSRRLSRFATSVYVSQSPAC